MQRTSSTATLLVLVAKRNSASSILFSLKGKEEEDKAVRFTALYRLLEINLDGRETDERRTD